MKRKQVNFGVNVGQVIQRELIKKGGIKMADPNNPALIAEEYAPCAHCYGYGWITINGTDGEQEEEKCPKCNNGEVMVNE